ncbi:MAG: GIY-YIG nuclease family protein [Treponema sp.]|jgi:hypothetical protein|nr:GIY-YIG nuclease family protein [Treponema sp.]
MGKVYILTNDAMPGIIKIGITEMETIEERMKSLDNTSVPKPFRFHYAIETKKYKEIEKLMHNAFSKFRIRNNREFFEMDAESAVAALKISGAAEIKLNNEMIDEKGTVIEEESIPTKKIFTFSQVNIPINSELSFTRDENIKCKVVSNREVEYEGEIYSLSGLAKILLNGMGYNWKSVQGPMYFKYNDKTLYEIRNEIESEVEIE